MPDLTNNLFFYYLSVLLDTRSFVGQSPQLFGLLQKNEPACRLESLVGKNTDICIESPSGSANSYFVNGFQMVNPEVRVAHHHHVAAQVTMGVRLRVPTVVLLRDPVDCVVSRAAFMNSPILIGPIFRQWIRFFRAAEQVRDKILIVSFESVTKQPEEVIRAINVRFGTSFNSKFPGMEQISARMDRRYAQVTGKSEQRNPNLPSTDKEAFKSRIRPFVMEHRLARPACDLYSRLVGAEI